MKRIYLIIPMILFASVVLADTPTLPSAKSCSITCYMQTPSCYVTKDKSGCLEISNVKPKQKKGEYICELKGCEDKSTY